ncbi:alpha/beta-hydrolase family protein [Nocardia sp. NPDC020380]|uniref:alpha/beta-hydrolase family protein n=1 Tax=Nocardia sp. NPDC020380 TaxID=3364309 RepID=UPI0037941D19
MTKAEDTMTGVEHTATEPNDPRPATPNGPGITLDSGSRWARVRFVPPRIGTTLAVTAAVLVSLAPGLLPRTPSAQAVLTALLVLIGLAVVGIGRMVLRRTNIGRNWSGRYALPALVAGVLASAGAIVYAQNWQNQLRAAMRVGTIGPVYWLQWILVTAFLVGLIVGVCRGLRWTVRRLGRARSTAIGVAVVLAMQFVLIPAAVQWRRDAYEASNSFVDPALPQPVSPSRSGSPVSMASWSSLGAEGRRFVTGTPARAVRVYVGLNSAPSLGARVALAIRELERTGGFDRANLVVTVPTGSGWIDGDAARGMDERFGGNVALVGLQYSDAPSWVTFLFGRSAAGESARALFQAVAQHISTMPHPPKLFMYGQSLGAFAGSKVFASDADQDHRTCGVLWAGPPAGQVNRGRAVVLANASDPVVRWSPRLIWRAPDLTGTRPDAPVPQWIPVVSFLQTSMDLLGALSAPPGHGHRYGTDQGTALPDC